MAVILRNHIILSELSRKTTPHRVNLHYWERTGNQNFGDYISLPIVEYMCKLNGISLDLTTKSTKHLYAVGSIINFGYQDATIWGSGLISTEPSDLKWKSNFYRKLDIRCVRGPETKRRLAENGYDVSQTKLGDPAILLPMIYAPTKEKELRPYGVIHHYLVNSEDNSNYNIPILTDDWRTVIDQIVNCQLIISSSLHGIIVAETYGIPAILLKEGPCEDMHKYLDYYYSTGRNAIPIADSVETALTMPIPEIPDFSTLRQELIDSFPVDLWKDNK